MQERNYAYHVLKHFNKFNKAPHAINLDLIARIQKITVKDIDPDSQVLGSIEEVKDTVTISLNRNRIIQRQRFVLAHELGHYFLKHTNPKPDTAEQMRRNIPEEIAANRFAAEILMPKHHVEILLRQGTSQNEMEAIFQVSSESMGYRLDNLGYEYDREYVFA